MPSTAKALPGVPAASKLPYLGSLMLGALGSTPTQLTERAVNRIKKSLPVPLEQEIIWADTVFGTRTHGLVLTTQGIFLKDGPSGDEDDDVDWSQNEGAGYHYLRWRNFDPEVLGVVKGKATIGGASFVDSERFLELARQCVRITKARRVAVSNAQQYISEHQIHLSKSVQSIFRKTAALTFDSCLELLNSSQAAKLPRIEVPSTQFDAVLQRLTTAVHKGKVPGISDPALLASIVYKGFFTYRQAVNLASTHRIPPVSFDSVEESVRCSNPQGLSFCLLSWLSSRSGVKGLDPNAEYNPEAVARASFEAAGELSTEAPKNAQEAALGFAANNAIYSAGRSVGAAGARVLVTALGITSGPLAAIASIALGNMCGDAVPEAFSMAKSLFIEPPERVYSRLFDGILQNVVFEYSLTQAEQAVFGALMRQVDPRFFHQLLLTLKDSSSQEKEIRDFLLPLINAVRSK